MATWQLAQGEVGPREQILTLFNRWWINLTLLKPDRVAADPSWLYTGPTVLDNSVLVAPPARRRFET